MPHVTPLRQCTQAIAAYFFAGSSFLARKAYQMAVLCQGSAQDKLQLLFSCMAWISQFVSRRQGDAEAGIAALWVQNHVHVTKPWTLTVHCAVVRSARQPVTWKTADGVGGEQRGCCGRNDGGLVILNSILSRHTCMVGATLAALLRLLQPGVVLVCVWENV